MTVEKVRGQEGLEEVVPSMWAGCLDPSGDPVSDRVEIVVVPQ